MRQNVWKPNPEQNKAESVGIKCQMEKSKGKKKQSQTDFCSMMRTSDGDIDKFSKTCWYPRDIFLNGICIFWSLWLLDFIISTSKHCLSHLLSATPLSWTLEEASRCSHRPAVCCPSTVTSPMFTISSSLNTPSVARSFDPRRAALRLWRHRSLVSFAWFFEMNASMPLILIFLL